MGEKQKQTEVIAGISKDELKEFIIGVLYEYSEHDPTIKNNGEYRILLDNHFVDVAQAVVDKVGTHLKHD